MRRLPPLTAVEAFVQVARLGSVKAAAEALALSAPALSRRVQAMERFVGRPLFDRRHQAMILSAEGARLLARIAPALETLNEAIGDVIGGGDLLRLRLSVAPLFAAQRLIGRLPELRQRHPELHIDIETAAHAVNRLGDGLDAAIVLTREVDPALYSRLIAGTTIVPVGARALMDGAGAADLPDRLAGATILLHRDISDAFELWRDAIGRPEIEPAAVDHFDSGQLMLEAAAQGLGIAFMLDVNLDGAHDPRLVRLSDAEVVSTCSYWFACRRTALSTRAVRLFHDWLFEQPR